MTHPRLAQIRMRKNVKVSADETLIQGLTYDVELVFRGRRWMLVRMRAWGRVKAIYDFEAELLRVI